MAHFTPQKSIFVLKLLLKQKVDVRFAAKIDGGVVRFLLCSQAVVVRSSANLDSGGQIFSDFRKWWSDIVRKMEVVVRPPLPFFAQYLGAGSQTTTVIFRTISRHWCCQGDHHLLISQYI